MSFRLLAAALTLAAASACVTAPTLDESRLIDLTHSLDEASPTPPGVGEFHYARLEMPAGEPWSMRARIDGSDRSGAYMQAPRAYAEGRRTVDEVALSQWIGPIRVIDAVRECQKDRSYLVGIDELKRHERMHGRIPPGAAALIRTGGDARWSTRERYFGIGQDQIPRYPGLSPELARELVARRVDLVGIDGPDVDGGLSFECDTSRLLAAANVPVLGNLAGLGALPPVGSTLIAAPMKIRGGGSAPARVFAILP